MTRYRLRQFVCQLGLHAVLFASGLIVGWNFNGQSSLDDYRNFNKKDQTRLTSDGRIIDLDQTYLTVVIFSGHANFDRRSCIRRTWIKLGGQRQFKHYFIIGTLELNEEDLNDLYNEQKLHNDLVLFDHLKDTYSALPLKLLTTLKWFASKINSKYLMKVDDDSFVRLDVLFDELVEKKLTITNMYWGYFDGRAHVKRSGQWAEKSWLLCDRYLPYALGGGYVISQQLVAFVAKNADMLQTYANEDVSLGVWLAPVTVSRVHDVRFDTEFKSRGCFNNYLITHKKSVDQMQSLYDNLKSTGKLCQKEFTLRNVYDYNWLVAPSSCCSRKEL